MPTDSPTIEARDQHGRGLRVTFVWQRDRFAHQVAAVHADRTVPLLVSVEGSDQDNWPPSPALQSVHIEDRPTANQVALLVGMAGTSHWSASVEIDTDRTSVLFDVACRVKDKPLRVGSRYCIAELPTDIDVQIDAAGQEFDKLIVQRSQDKIDLVVSLTSAVLPTTLRWQYRVVVQRSIDRINR